MRARTPPSRERTLARAMRSRIRWLARTCGSHDVSQFAALFIDTRAEASTMTSCGLCFWFRGPSPGGENPPRMGARCGYKRYK